MLHDIYQANSSCPEDVLSSSANNTGKREQCGFMRIQRYISSLSPIFGIHLWRDFNGKTNVPWKIMVLMVPVLGMSWSADRRVDPLTLRPWGLPNWSQMRAPWCWNIYLHNWAFLLGQWSVNLPAPWSGGEDLKCIFITFFINGNTASSLDGWFHGPNRSYGWFWGYCSYKNPQIETPKQICHMRYSLRDTHYIWLVVWNIFYFPMYWECHHPNWLSYFSEGWPNHHQMRYSLRDTHYMYYDFHIRR